MVQPLIESREPLLNERGLLIAFASRAGRKQRISDVRFQAFWAITQRHGSDPEPPARLRHPRAQKHMIAA
jgi:hypothetical protein